MNNFESIIRFNVIKLRRYENERCFLKKPKCARIK